MAEIPRWYIMGDWFDTCNCNIPCPCTFAQPPTNGNCEGILAWHIRKGNYGDVRLDGLSVMALGTFTGNIWEGKTKASMAMFIDERADQRQREALHLESWRAEIPGKVKSSAEALGGPTTPPGKRVQVHNAGGCETGPGGVATYGKSTADKADAFGFKWERTGRSSKHIGFDWSGPDA